MKKVSIFVFSILYYNVVYANDIYSVSDGSSSARDYYRVNYDNISSNSNIDYYTSYGLKSSNTEYYSEYQNKSYKKSDIKKSVSKQSNYDRFFITPSYVMEWAEFNFDMNTAGSVVSWKDMFWNTLKVNAGYEFPIESMNLSPIVKMGYAFGSIGGSDGRGYDDDLYNGGYMDDSIFRAVYSVGDISGKKNDVYASFGIADFIDRNGFKFGIDLGYRYFNHKLKIKDSMLLSYDYPTTLDTGVYYISGVSHDYRTVWQGPFIAFNMSNSFSDSSYFSFGVELGLPSYDSEGRWGYRSDLADIGFEDTGKIGDSYHIGLNMNYESKITNHLFYVISGIFDYYSLSDGKTKTNLVNGTSYTVDKELNAKYKSVGLNIGLKLEF